MVRCNKCNTEYEDYASYCNICDIPLTDESGANIEEKSSVVAADVGDVLFNARKNAAGVHRFLGWMYVIILALLAFVWIMVESSGKHDYAFLLLFIVPAAIHLIAAEGLIREKSWARTLSIVIGFIILPGFPLGTICGLIILFQMFKKEWRLNAVQSN